MSFVGFRSLHRCMRHYVGFSKRNSSCAIEKPLGQIYTPVPRLQVPETHEIRFGLPTRMNEDPVSNILCLEEDYYKEGWNTGIVDGSMAGRVEGRAIGIEKGFEKFTLLGNYHGRTLIWGAKFSPKCPLIYSSPSRMRSSFSPWTTPLSADV